MRAGRQALGPLSGNRETARLWRETEVPGGQSRDLKVAFIAGLKARTTRPDIAPELSADGSIASAVDQESATQQSAERQCLTQLAEAQLVYVQRLLLAEEPQDSTQ